MIIQIKPIEIDSETADQLLVQVHTHSMTETSLNIYYNLNDSTQNMTVGEKVLPYKILKWEILKVEGEYFEKIKEDEKKSVEYVINKLKIENK